MTRDDIVRMAREAGLHSAVLLHIYAGKEAALTDSERDELRKLERFFKLAYEAGAAAEREACAIAGGAAADAGRDVAAVIRARGQPDRKVTHLNAWARDRLARHGIPMPGDDDGNPSF
jgi:hypothetical protein